MGNSHDSNHNRERLRDLARGAVRGQEPDLEALSPEDLKVLIHEYGVYQVELEAQNEELRETRHELENARDRYRELYDFAPVGYLTLDGDGFIRESNLEAARLFELPRASLSGRELGSLLAEGSSRELKRLFGKKHPETLEARTASSPRERHLRLDIVPDVEEERTEFLVAVIDISEARRAEEALRRSEERFRTLSETAPLGIFETNRSGRFTYVNQRWEKITGLPADQSLAFGWAHAVHPADRRRVTGEWAGRVGEGPWIQEFRLNRGDGSEAWARMLSAPSAMVDGRPMGFVGTLEDITELRQAQDDMRRARKSAEDANRSKSEFLANMSHEIRTPMTVTLGALDLLIDFVTEEQHRQLVEMAASSSESLLKLLDGILDFSKIEAGKMELHMETCSLTGCLEKSLPLFALEAEKKGLRFSTDLRPGLPEAILCDPDRVQQILRNLVANAVKFTERGEITVGAEPVDGAVRFFVRDTGIGIPPEKIEGLFQSFNQLDASRTRKYGGTGLGLAICKGLTELMGGTLGAESEPGNGSVFHFTLPLREIPAEKKERDAGESKGGMEPLTARVLLVEDDDMVRSMVEKILSRWRCEVVPASTGAEAVRIWEEGCCDLILMDVQMPDMGGMEATRLIREKERETGTHIPIIALTAHARKEDQRECLEAGMDAWVAKPIHTRKLHEAISRQLDRLSG